MKKLQLGNGWVLNRHFWLGNRFVEALSFPVLAISGSVGVGKSSVLVEIHDILSRAKVPHGCVERDAVGYSWPVHGRFNEEMIERNLACIIKNFLAAKAEYLLIAGVI